VQEEASFSLQKVDLSQERGVQRDALLEAEIGPVVSYVFDLGMPPALVAKLVKLEQEEFILVFCLHHIVSDAWSNPILARDLSEAYRLALQTGEDVHLSQLSLQYGDYCLWQRRCAQDGEWTRQIEEWNQYLGPDVPALDLPMDYPRPAQKRFEGASIHFSLPADLQNAVRNFCKAERVMPSVPLFAAWQVLLAKYSGQEEFAIGVPITGRMREELHDLIGFFVNTLVFKANLASPVSWRQLCHQIRAEFIQGMSNATLPFELLITNRHDQRSPGRDPLFQVMFDIQMQDAPLDLKIEGITAEIVERHYAGSKFDLSLDVLVKPDEIGGRLEFDTAIFREETAAHLVDYYARTLESLVTQPDELFVSGVLLSDQEREELMCWGVNKERYPEARPVHRLIEERVKEQPEAIALVFGEEELSYAELNARANRLANRLITLGVRPESKVGVALERSTALIVSLLAVLKAGGAYVPLDPEYPEERLGYMVRDSRIGLLITDSRSRAKLPDEGIPILELDGLDLTNGPDTDPQVAINGKNLAYVVYTSGSTGTPKGTLLCHRNASRLLNATQEWFHFDSKDIWTLFHSYAFDFSVWEMFGALCTGGRLIVVPYWVSRSPEEFLMLLRDQRVTILNQTPSAFGQLIQAVEQDTNKGEGLFLRYVIFGGEALEPEMLKPWLARFGDERPRLVNMYGITETTVHVTYRPIARQEVESGQRSPVGINIPDLALRVLDSALNLTPVGVPGELYVGGDGLARGYLNRSGLTSERFIADPFDESGGRLYRTGDLVRWNAEGQLEYLGRIDHQVKIRGFRIELGEVEARLLAEEEVREAVVVSDAGPDGARLVGYVSLHAGQEVDGGALRERLARTLPEYMVPSAIVVLGMLPLNVNGKIDRRALPKAEFGDADRYEAPVGEIEETLARIWVEVLSVPRVGRNANFFHIGGHSIALVKMQMKVREVFSVQIPLRVYFENPILRDIGCRIHIECRNAGASTDNNVPEDNFKQFGILLDELDIPGDKPK
jgi:amino acid adenylation domain-containing protein